MTLIRRFLSTALAASLVTFATAADGKISIATVDMQELFKQYYKTNEAQKQLSVDFARIQKDVNERKAKIRDLNTSFESLKKQIDDPSINDSKRQSLSKDAQVQYQDLIALDRECREFEQRRRQALEEKKNQRMRGIFEEIRKLVEEQAKVDNYDFVLDKSGLSQIGVPFILYSKDATDVTAVLLKNLNKDAPAGSLPSDDDKDTKIDLTQPTPTGDDKKDDSKDKKGDSKDKKGDSKDKKGSK